MHIRDIFQQRKTTFSFEFFPPKTEKGWEKLLASVRELESLKPSYVSVTYGAGGSTREKTHDLVLRLKKDTGVTTVPHLTCVMHSEEEINLILRRYADAGVSNILALGGDPPQTETAYDRSKDTFRYATDLVAHIKRFGDTYKRDVNPDFEPFGICVAGFPEGHPATHNRLTEMDHLKAKIDAGADWICTQLFFDNRDFYDFRERCEIAGINVPIVAGIMPITSGTNLRRMADLAAGARFPAKLLRSIERCAGDADAVQRVGLHWATEQCRDLLDNNVRGIHFYTLNSSTSTREIYANLGVKDSISLA